MATRPTWIAALLGAVLLPIVSGCMVNEQRRAVIRSEALVAEAEDMIAQGLTDKALETFMEAIEENPNLTEAHIGVGSILRDRGDHAAARTAYEEAVRTDPNNFDANYYLGLMNQLLGDLHKAVRTYLRALAINPQSFEANRDLASAYLQLGRPGEAIPYAKRATELDPDSQPAWSNLAAAYSLVRDYENAIDAYRQAAELGELADPVLLGLADAHIRLGNYGRAINTLNSLIRQSPSSTAYERLGFAQYKLRRYESALENFNKALEIDPRDTAAMNGVGVCMMTLYIEGGQENKYQKTQAIQSWRKSVQLRPDQPRIIDLLSRYGRL